MYTSKITQRGQATIPAAIRKQLNLDVGDCIAFDSDDEGNILIKKAEPVDILFLQSLNSSLTNEWNSDSDSEAYDDL